MKTPSYEYFRDKDENVMTSFGKSNKFGCHFHRNLELHYFTDDGAITEVGDSRFTADCDDIVFINNYTPHAVENPHTKYFIIIPPAYSNDLDKTLSRKTLSPHLADKEFNRTLLPIIKTLCENKSLPSLVKKGYLDILFGSLLAHYPTHPNESPKDMDFIIRILRYIEEHSGEPITLDTLSAHFGYNKYYFSRIFNRSVGTNLSSYLGFVRLRTFMRLKKEHKNEKITKLASLAGFDSLPTFYRTFAAVYNTSPKEYFGI